MKTRTLIILFIIESVVMVRLFMWTFGEGTDGNNKTELLREISPDGDYVLLIEELGKPVLYSKYYASDRIKVTLYQNNSHENYCESFRVEISTRGDTAQYEIEWMEDGVRIVFSGWESDYCYILPFKASENITGNGGRV